jgi:L-ascorbate metabolism protein UlaG (beta-lactamase superfamily)
VRITYVGHSTALIELDGLRLLTDPVLRKRVAHLNRSVPPADLDTIGIVDFVLISHLHHDHFDPGSLRMLDGRFELVVPRGAHRAAATLGFDRITELKVDESLTVGGISISATRAVHRRGRLLDQRSEAVGFTIAGSQHVYFAGDTDIFPEMRELSLALDVALLPIGGWGPRLGSGHLDPTRAAESLTLLDPRIAVPIHWGTLHRIGLRRSRRAWLDHAPRAFASEAARLAPSVEVRILDPGQTTDIEPVGA